MTTISTLTAVLRLDKSRFKSDVESAQRDMEGFEGRMQKTGKRMQSTGKRMTMGITGPLAAVGALSARTAASFDQNMQQSIAVMGDVDEAMREDLEATAREVANTTTMSADQAAESYYFLASAGLDATQAMESMPQVAAFAEAGQMDMAEATDVATNVMSAYGVEAENMSDVTDVMTATVTSHNQTMEGMSAAFTNAAPAAASMGVEIEELAALTGALGDQGIQGADAGTALNSIMRRMAKRSGEAGQALEELGIETTNANGELLPLTEIIGQLEDANMTAAQSSAIFGRQMSAGNALVSTGADELNEYQATLERADGATQDVASTQRETLNSQLAMTKSNLEDVGITIGAIVLPMLSTLTGYVKGAAEWFQGLSDTQQKTIVAMGGLLAVGGPMLWLLGTLITSASAVAGAMGTLAAVNVGAVIPSILGVNGSLTLMNVLLSPITLTILALVAAIGALALAWKKDWGNIRSHTEDGVNAVGDLLNWLIDKINKIPGVDIDWEASDVDFTSSGGGGSGGGGDGGEGIEPPSPEDLEGSDWQTEGEVDWENIDAPSMPADGEQPASGVEVPDGSEFETGAGLGGGGSKQADRIVTELQDLKETLQSLQLRVEMDLNSREFGRIIDDRARAVMEEEIVR